MGATAGICGQCSSYPLDIVRRRMQTAGTLVSELSIHIGMCKHYKDPYQAVEYRKKIWCLFGDNIIVRKPVFSTFQTRLNTN